MCACVMCHEGQVLVKNFFENARKTQTLVRFGFLAPRAQPGRRRSQRGYARLFVILAVLQGNDLIPRSMCLFSRVSAEKFGALI